MKFNLTREEMHDHLKVKKAALLSIAINVLEIIAGVVMMLLVRKVLLGGVEESIVRMVSSPKRPCGKERLARRSSCACTAGSSDVAKSFTATCWDQAAWAG